MLLARYAPIGSPRYEKLSKSSVKFDKIIEWFPSQLFGIWTIFVAGMAAGKAQIDRYYFWDWCDWLIGVIGISVISFIYNYSKKKLNIKEIDELEITKNTITTIYYALLIILLFGVGWFITNSSNIHDLINCLIPIFIFYVGISYIYSIKKEDTQILDQKQKNSHSIAAISALIICILWGYSNDLPVIATASIVALPFLIVLLFGKHIRHLERAKFYPLFIFAMFVTSREAWFLISILLLFFVLRSYNYLRYQKVYPTFGVTDDHS